MRLLVVGALMLAAQAAHDPANSYLRFEPAVIVDATGFARPVGAATLFIPHGWRTEGGVYWAADFLCVNGYNFIWRAMSPDGSMSIGISPQMAWAFAHGGPASPQPGCPTVAITSVRQYLQSNLARSLPDARILDYRDRPDLVAEVGAQSQRTPMPMGEVRRWAEGGEILFAYRENGRDMRGTSSAVVQFQKTITDMSSAFANDLTVVQTPGQEIGRIESVNGYAYPGFFATAPNGRLDIRFFEALRRTIKPNPQWTAQIAGHNAAIGRVALDESRKRSEMLTRASGEIARIRQQTWNAHQESADRRAREFGELMKGVETYADADTPAGRVELPSQYNHAFRLNDGSYVLSDDPDFDPWRNLQIEGRRLEAVP